MSWVFCAIVAGQAAAIPIYEDDNYLAILDIRPFTRGHTLGRRLVKGWGSAQRCPLSGPVLLGGWLLATANCYETARANIVPLHLADQLPYLLSEPRWKQVRWGSNAHYSSEVRCAKATG
jgi:hypothetical protein